MTNWFACICHMFSRYSHDLSYAPCLACFPILHIVMHLVLMLYLCSSLLRHVYVYIHYACWCMFFYLRLYFMTYPWNESLLMSAPLIFDPTTVGPQLSVGLVSCLWTSCNEDCVMGAYRCSCSTREFCWPW